MPDPRHRRPTQFWVAAGLIVAAVSALGTLVSAVADGFGEVREQTQPSPAGISAAPGDALRVSVQGTGAGDASCLRSQYVARGGLRDLRGDPAPPVALFGPDESDAWFAAHGATPTAGTVVFTVESLRQGRAILRDLRAVVDGWEPAPRAVRIVPTGGGCGAHLDIQDFGLTLRDVRRPIMTVPQHRTKGFPYTVAEDDPIQFEVFVDPPAGIATWHLELRWTFAGEAHTTRLPSGAGTFRSGAGPAYCPETLAELTGTELAGSASPRGTELAGSASLRGTELAGFASLRGKTPCNR
ncbi:hypothetical protein GCM10010168_63490 [Actinoplanes ianthinogenes]|uniref:Uncharacterized protein n=1 Tax=Actinoplanes ianthinogenes TaxID=122358 RepID=A0ABN6C2R6_9ACTN|nr:hypothetical protein [Actinoplanes ianthinogenes]BCJ39403.1 hypothetical protein Aiant_00600 [Actinoplanes ianthinogenes]GGR36372.1 hypothetical protein GCM10010168_63490 [Actinoplanes ianthinogenes]